MLTQMIHAARRLRQDERGFSIVEFAFVAPIFGLMLVGIGDLARGYSERYALQQAVNRTLELAQLGTDQPNYNHLIPEAAAAAGVPESNVTLQSWLECDATRRAWTDSCAENQQIARYVSLTIDSSFRPSFGTAGYTGARADGTVPIRASAFLRVQ